MSSFKTAHLCCGFAFWGKRGTGQMWRRQHQHQLGNQSCTTWAQTLAGKSKVSVDENKQPTTKSPVFCAPCAIFVMNRVSFKSPL